jgi:hypothetical protein
MNLPVTRCDMEVTLKEFTDIAPARRLAAADEFVQRCSLLTTELAIFELFRARRKADVRALLFDPREVLHALHGMQQRSSERLHLNVTEGHP